jgi:hypothetical protein
MEALYPIPLFHSLLFKPESIRKLNKKMDRWDSETMEMIAEALVRCCRRVDRVIRYYFTPKQS